MRFGRATGHNRRANWLFAPSKPASWRCLSGGSPDVLQKREPFYGASASLLAAVETGRVQGYVATHSLTTLFYLVQKDKSSAEARATITNLLQFIKIAPVDQSTIEQALTLDYRDFEDASR
jgi:hypothetical protein